MSTRLRLASFLLFLLLPVAVLAQDVPLTMSFSARLQEDGQPAQAPHRLRFALFDKESKGKEVWAEDHASVTAQDGRITLELGLGKPLGAEMLDGSKRWLEVTVDDTVLSPRLAITSVPYAIRAGVASRADGMTGQPGASASVISELTVQARSDCSTVAPVPRMAVFVNREPVAEIEIASSSIADYPVMLPQPTYVSEIAIAFLNDSDASSCDHNLHVQSVSLPDGTVLAATRGQNVIYDTGEFFDGLEVEPATTALVRTGALRFFLGPQVIETASASYVTAFPDWRNNDASCTFGTWCDVPSRKIVVRKKTSKSLLKITYTDTTGTLGSHYMDCTYRVMVDNNSVLSFSDVDADVPGGTVAWRMHHASHVGLAPGVAAGTHTIKVQNFRGARGTPVQECLMGWNTGGTSSLLVEELP